MGFFKRLKNVIEAKANKALDKHENPIEMLELSKNKKEKLLQNAKKQELATRLDVAQINNEINETLAGLGDDHGINLDELEKKVAQKENYGKALENMKTKNEDQMLDEYINSSPVVDSKVEDELERIKREMEK